MHYEAWPGGACANSRQNNFFETLKYEFDQLYFEGETRTRQMSISTHDRIGGAPAVVHARDKFLEYVNKYSEVAIGILHIENDFLKLERLKLKF